MVRFIALIVLSIASTMSVFADEVVTPEEVPLPRIRPTGPRDAEFASLRESIVDCESCTFSDCNETRYEEPWKSMTTMQRARRMVANVRYVNSLHDMQVDPRYFLCTGYRESKFNPNAANCGSTAEGMFQVLDGTAEEAIGRYDSKVYGFTDYGWRDYKNNMAKSSVAQAELSLMVIMIKASRIDRSEMLRDISKASVEGYAEVANSYFGLYRPGHKLYNASQNYKNAIKGCYECVVGIVPDNGVIPDDKEDATTACLEKATH